MDFFRITIDYFFSSTPGRAFNFYIPIIVLIVLLIGGGIAFSYLYKKKKKEDFAFKRLFKKTSSRMVLFGFILLLLLLFRYENIPYFAMRLWLYTTLIILLIFIYKTLKTYKYVYPKERENAKRRPLASSKKENVYSAKKKRK